LLNIRVGGAATFGLRRRAAGDMLARMGLKDRLTAVRRHLSSPIHPWLAEMGSDRVAVAGQSATVVVDLRGEADPTAERVDVFLRLTAFDVRRDWPLAEIPPTLGVHRVPVVLPTGLAPSCAKYAEYTFGAKVQRPGLCPDAASVVDVIARPEDVHWPDGPRAEAHGVDVALDAEAVDAGGALTGTVVAAAPGEVTVALELLATAPYGHKGEPRTTTRTVATTVVAASPGPVPFTLAVPAGVPPTLHNGGHSSVVWRVRAGSGGATGWRLVAVLDPTAAAGVRDRPSPTLLEFLGGLDAGR
jgi:hypothetical protein